MAMFRLLGTCVAVGVQRGSHLEAANVRVEKSRRREHVFFFYSLSQL